MQSNGAYVVDVSYRKLDREALNLLCAPAGIRVPHVGGRLNGWEEFEASIENATSDDDGTRNVVDRPSLEAETADQNVDYVLVRRCVGPSVRANLQIPRPKKLNKKDAYLGRYGGTWGRSSRPPTAISSQTLFPQRRRGALYVPRPNPIV
jgi:hypothetical protein